MSGQHGPSSRQREVAEKPEVLFRTALWRRSRPGRTEGPKSVSQGRWLNPPPPVPVAMSFTAGLVVCLVLPHRHPRVRSKGCGPCRHQTDGDGIGIRLEESVPTDPVLRPGTVVKGWRDRCAAGLEPGQLIFEPGNALLCLVLVRPQSFAKSQNRVNGWLDRQAKHDASHQDEHDEAREKQLPADASHRSCQGPQASLRATRPAIASPDPTRQARHEY